MFSRSFDDAEITAAPSKGLKHFRRIPFCSCPIRPFTMAKAGPGKNRRTGIMKLVAGRTVGQS